MTMNISVGIMGFSPREEKKFKKIFEISQLHERSYNLVDTSDVTPVDILIIKEGDEFVSQQQQSYCKRHAQHPIHLVRAGRETNTQDTPYFLKGVIIASRVFSVLDCIEKQEVIEKETENLIPETIDTNQEQVTQTTTQTSHNSNTVFNVLVVDDSQMMQKTVQLELEKATIPLAIDFADSGEMALEKVPQKKYDFIFLDVMMPGIDGFETCTEIRKMDGMAKTPIIMLTSKTSAMDEVKGLMAGCSTYLTKPFEHDEFQKILERIMRWVKEFNKS